MSDKFQWAEIILLCVMNAVGFISMGLDKYAAKKHQYRMPEKFLFAIAIFGGSIGVMIGMIFFRHKTRHIRFTVGIPAILIIQVLLVYYFNS